MSFGLKRVGRYFRDAGRRGVAGVLPDELVRSLVGEIRMAALHGGAKLRNRRRFRKHRNLHINVGCGPHPLHGWVNVDIIKAPGIVCWDCRRSLPFEDESAAFIFAEHFFEHLERPRQTAIFLRECLRCLQPGGIVRLVVPDAGMYLRLYCEPGWQALAAARPLENEGERYRDTWIGERYATKMEMINAVFRQNGQHRYAYDAETLLLTLKEAGFAETVHCRYRESRNGIPPDRIERRSESLYVEGIKG
jgi:predicted SAM-dependent methyltransferase